MHDRPSIMTVLLLALSTAGGVRAQTVSITPNPGLLSGPPGSTLTMHVTLTNTTDASLHLAGISLNGDQTMVDTLTLDDAPFVMNAPVTLAQGASWEGDIFDVIVGPGSRPGTYPGSFTVLGGATSADLDPLGTQAFSVEVSGSAVPEPGSLALILPALVPPGLVLRRRKKSA